MASTIRPASNYLAKLSWYVSHASHSVWDRFSADEQQRMIHDDLLAGTSVSLVLFSVITAGLVMSIVTLLVILAAS